MEVKLQGDYINPSGYSADDSRYLTPELLMKFLISNVSSISQFESWSVFSDPEAKTKKQKLVFCGLFKLKNADSEEFLFDLNHWPLGVQNIIYCEH